MVLKTTSDGFSEAVKIRSSVERGDGLPLLAVEKLEVELDLDLLMLVAILLSIDAWSTEVPGDCATAIEVEVVSTCGGRGRDPDELVVTVDSDVESLLDLGGDLGSLGSPSGVIRSFASK